MKFKLRAASVKIVCPHTLYFSMSSLRSLAKVLRVGINSPTRKKDNYGVGLQNMFNAASGARLSKATETSFRAVKTIPMDNMFLKTERCIRLKLLV